MKKIGIICEFNPFHNGHLHFINQIKKKYPDSILILIISGYLTQRGEFSLIDKYNKVDISLNYGVDIVIELPTIYTLNSADLFANHSVGLLNQIGIDILAFGSESGDLEKLIDFAKIQLENKIFNNEVKWKLKKGNSYSKSIFDSLETNLNSNDILGVSYIKAIIKSNYKIKPVLIKRTNDFNDIKSNDRIVSATNIRNKFNNNIQIDKYIPIYNKSYIKKMDQKKLFDILKYKIITDNNLEEYLGVNEGLSNRLLKYIYNSRTLDELIDNIKSKRHSASRIKRMLMCILFGIKKSDILIDMNYVRLLGFNIKGRKYLSTIKNKNISTANLDKRIFEIEKRVSLIYDYISDDTSYLREQKNLPIKKENKL